MTVSSKLRIAGFLTAGLIAVSSACSSAPQGVATPTVEAIPATATASATLTATTSATAAAIEVTQVSVASATPTASPEPPTLTPTASDTPGPYEYTIQAGDTLGFIVAQFGYTDLSTGPGSIIDLVVRLNGLVSADILPGAGTQLFIPRQTSTPTPQNIETAVAVEATNTASAPNIQLNTVVTQYVVQENDTLAKIAQDYNTTLAVLFYLNPDLPGIFSCNPEIPSGGEGCNVTLSVGQGINVPAPTPTPTLSPTPSGNETVTPTPTLAAPVLIFPPNGANAPAGVFTLQWVSVGILDANESYLLEVTDETVGEIVLRVATKSTSYTLPDTLIPTDGQPHIFSWRVWIAKPNEQGVYGRIGGVPFERRFQWQSR